MYDPERGWSLSFAGCGFLGFYYVGVTSCLSERAPHLLRHARKFFGASAGALHCAFYLAGIPLEQRLQMHMDLIQSIRSRILGILHPGFNLSKYVRDGLHRHLPDNVHQLLSGKIAISLTRVSDGENVLVSDFHCKDEVVDSDVNCVPPAVRSRARSLVISKYHLVWLMSFVRMPWASFHLTRVHTSKLPGVYNQLLLSSQCRLPPNLQLVGPVCDGPMGPSWAIPWRRKRHPGPAFLPGKPHRRRTLAGVWAGSFSFNHLAYCSP
ncbi:hypothetical protein FD754_024058, partial [Muntiacus muntjak]